MRNSHPKRDSDHSCALDYPGHSADDGEQLQADCPSDGSSADESDDMLPHTMVMSRAEVLGSEFESDPVPASSRWNPERRSYRKYRAENPVSKPNPRPSREADLEDFSIPDRRQARFPSDKSDDSPTMSLTNVEIMPVSYNAFPDRPVPCLEISEGFEEGKLFDVPVGSSTIGRGGSSDIRLIGHGISRNHVKLSRDNRDCVTIVDVGSTNGTYINGKPLIAHQLDVGDNLRLGPETVLLFSYLPERQLRAHQEKYELLTRDEMTGVFGRRFFDRCLDYELDAAKRFSDSLVLMLIDIDHFKRVNDTFGHLAGDEAIRSIAQGLNSSLRNGDFFARIGGEEFAAIIRGVDLQQGAVLAERLRLQAESEHIAWDGHEFKCTVSIGITKLASNDEAAATLLQRADENLYKAKCAGRNRCVAI